MDLGRLSLWCLVVATAAMGLIATPARADIVLFDNYLLPSPIGNPAAELAFVQARTGETLDLFQTNDADGTEQLFTVESVSVTEILVTRWHLDWTTVNWDIRYVLVMDGATPGAEGGGNGGGGGGGEGADGEGSDGEGDAGPDLVLQQSPGGEHIYTLWAVTAIQFKDGDGDVFLQAFPEADIAHITIFGQNNPPNPPSVPEAATLFLLGVGLSGVVALRGRPR